MYASSYVYIYILIIFDNNKMQNKIKISTGRPTGTVSLLGRSLHMTRHSAMYKSVVVQFCNLYGWSIPTLFVRKTSYATLNTLTDRDVLILYIFWLFETIQKIPIVHRIMGRRGTGMVPIEHDDTFIWRNRYYKISI